MSTVGICVTAAIIALLLWIRSVINRGKRREADAGPAGAPSPPPRGVGGFTKLALAVFGLAVIGSLNRTVREVEAPTASAVSEEVPPSPPKLPPAPAPVDPLQEKREAKAKAEEARKVAKYGQAPIQSGYDGSYDEAERFIKGAANDPGSIEMAGCTHVAWLEKEGWLIGCNFRGKNAFGALVKNFKWFVVKNGRVVKSAPADRYSTH